MGTNCNEFGRSCAKHPICGVLGVKVGGLVSLQFVQLKHGNWDKPAIEVCWVVSGQDSCHVGFLQSHFIPYAAHYNGQLAKVM